MRHDSERVLHDGFAKTHDTHTDHMHVSTSVLRLQKR